MKMGKGKKKNVVYSWTSYISISAAARSLVPAFLHLVLFLQQLSFPAFPCSLKIVLKSGWR